MFRADSPFPPPGRFWKIQTVRRHGMANDSTLNVDAKSPNVRQNAITNERKRKQTVTDNELPLP